MIRRRAAVVLATASVLAAVSAAQAATPSASTGWAPTATRALVLNLPELGPVPAGQPVRVSVALALPDRAALYRAAIAASTPGSPSFHHFLTPAQVRARFGPDPARVREVAGWLARLGFRDVQAEPNGLLVDALGPAGLVSRAFHTPLRLYRDGARVVFANTAPAQVPTSLGGAVAAVLGLSDLPLATPHVVAPAAAQRHLPGTAAGIPTAGVPDLFGFTPVQIAKIYDASGLTPARDTSIAVVASGDMTSTIADLRYAEGVYKVPRVPVTVVPTAPLPAVVVGNPYTGNLEWDLDTQMSTIDAGFVRHLYIYDGASIDDADVTRDINLFVAQDLAQAGSASLGECDVSAYLDGAMITTDAALAEGALQGQSFFASSGDNGFACPEIASTGVPGGVPGTSWPADGFFTTGVGGTTLLASSDGQYQGEVAWIGGGGGISEFESAGGWTYVANKVATAGEFLPSGGRGVPDISAVADPNTPVIVYQGKAQQFVGGTSVSSPLSMGLWARMQTQHHNRLGLAALDFYLDYNQVNATTQPPTGAPGFHDIVAGSNGLYPATPGYDYVTGIGSFDTAVLNGRL